MQTRYSSYDHQRAAFGDALPSCRRGWLKGFLALSLAVVLAAAGVGVLSRVAATPAEVARQDEIEALRRQLMQARSQLREVSDELAAIAAADRELYRAAHDAGPAGPSPGAAFGLGVGGAEDRRFNRLAAPTRELLRETDRAMERLGQQMARQGRSYDQLRALAGQQDAELRQHPAILPVREGRLTSGFGMRFHPILRASRMHTGVDFAVPVGTPVYATGDGTVTAAGEQGGYGLTVELEHPLAGRRTRYAHLLRPAAGVRPGVAVRRGEVIAYSGNSGLSTAPHLHYEILGLADAAVHDPVRTFVAGVSPSQYRALVEAASRPTASLH